MEWTNDLIMDFLNLYQNEPALWNSKHTNKYDAYNAWNRIKSKLKDGNIPIQEIKKKRDNLMTTYRRQRLRVIQCMGADSEADVKPVIYKPDWPFYSVMATFLDDIYKPKKRKSSEDPLETENIEEDTSVDDDDETEPISKIPETSHKKASKRSKINECDKMKKRERKKRKDVSQKPDSDTCSLYCDLLCNKLRALKESTRDIAMMEIDTIMFNLKQQDNDKK